MSPTARQPLRIAPDRGRFRAMVGVGGIGSGSFFLLNGNHTLGREESRGGRFQDRRDYCKLHIISHYVKALLGPGFPVIPVGKVGDDDVGRRLLAEMKPWSTSPVPPGSRRCSPSASSIPMAAAAT